MRSIRCAAPLIRSRVASSSFTPIVVLAMLSGSFYKGSYDFISDNINHVATLCNRVKSGM
ncbi:hypothetical protein CU280_06095 [Yersinia mollaretii]|nr:hypothetical protein CS537_14910 [Yersinia mollaretii]PJE88675.1 hypothetical protein CU280_06095 [Yersinia mollaretii]